MDVRPALVALEHGCERGDALPREPPVEPGPGVERGQRGPRVAGHGPVPVGRPVDHVVVDHDDLAVDGGVHVELDVGGAHRQSQVERRERVLGRVRRGAAMGDGQEARPRFGAGAHPGAIILGPCNLAMSAPDSSTSPKAAAPAANDPSAAAPEGGIWP